VDQRAKAAFDLARERSSNTRLREVLGAWQQGSGEHYVSDGRGLAMLMISEDEEKSFEWDNAIKGYAEHNHQFADLLVPIGSRTRWPILFFLSRHNVAGVRFEQIEGDLTLIYLGPGYSLGDVSAAVSYALRQQGIRIPRAWFLRMLAKHGLNPLDASYSSFWAVDEPLGQKILAQREELRGAHAIMRAPPEDISLWGEGLMMLFGVDLGRAGFIRISGTGPWKLVPLAKAGDDDFDKGEVLGSSDIAGRLQRSDFDLVILEWDTAADRWRELHGGLLGVDAKTLIVMPKGQLDISQMQESRWRLLEP
jgi:hypothetical protein